MCASPTTPILEYLRTARALATQLKWRLVLFGLVLVVLHWFASEFPSAVGHLVARGDGSARKLAPSVALAARLAVGLVVAVCFQLLVLDCIDRYQGRSGKSLALRPLSRIFTVAGLVLIPTLIALTGFSLAMLIDERVLPSPGTYDSSRNWVPPRFVGESLVSMASVPFELLSLWFVPSVLSVAACLAYNRRAADNTSSALRIAWHIGIWRDHRAMLFLLVMALVAVIPPVLLAPFLLPKGELRQLAMYARGSASIPGVMTSVLLCVWCFPVMLCTDATIGLQALRRVPEDTPSDASVPDQVSVAHTVRDEGPA